MFKIGKRALLKILIGCILAIVSVFLLSCGSRDFKYNVDFIVDGETVATVGTDSQTIKMPKNPEKEGFAFDGWYWDEGKWDKPFTLNSIANQPIAEENRFAVYAKWKSTTEYVVKFVGGVGRGEMADVTIKRGEATALPKNTFTPSNGYAFDGWNTQADGSGTRYADTSSVLDLCAAGESVSLYAQWRKAVCTLIFYANGGTGDMSNTQAQTYESVTVPCAFTPPSGKQFEGWNSQADGSGDAYSYREKGYFPVADGTVISLYAQWGDKVKEYYTLSFNANGGKGTMPSRKAEVGAEITVGQPAFTPPDEERAFGGWNTKADGSGRNIAVDEPIMDLAGKNQTVTLYAQWTINVYTITFVNSNGEDSSYKTRKVAVGERITLGEGTGFTPPQYCQFECWRLATETPAYALTEWRAIGANEEVVNLAEAGETVYLHADWKIAEGIQLYTVSTFSQLQAALQNKVSQNTVVVLDQDIVCAEGQYLNSCPEFAGVFIGNGHTIKNLRIAGDNSGEVQSGGLFGNITATGKVIGLALENVRADGSYAASFAYKNEGEIRSCSVVNGTVNFVGNPLDTDVMACGLVCENAAGASLVDCYYSGTLVGSLQSGNGNAFVAGICFKNEGGMQNVYFYGNMDVLGSIVAANLFCIAVEGSVENLAYCEKEGSCVNGVVYDNRLQCDYAQKWTKEELYQNRYLMGCGGVMYEEMDLAKGSLGYVGVSYNNWYHN